MYQYLKTLIKFQIYLARPEISQCLRRGLLCPNGTTCVQSANDTFECVCKEGLKLIGGPQNFTCKEGK